MRHQGITFVERFDANSYLYLTRAMDYFDLAADYDGARQCVPRHAGTVLRDLIHQRLVVPDPEIARHRARAQCRRRAVSFAEVTTDKGHDAFLLDEPELFTIVRGFLEGAARGARAAAGAEITMLMRLKHDLAVAEAHADRAVRASTCSSSPTWWSAARASRRQLRRSRIAAPVRNPGVDGRDIELSREGVNECVAKGLAVVQGDADADLENFPDDAFDFVILSQTLQATRRPPPGARAHAAYRTARNCFVSEFRPLAHPPAGRIRRAYAAYR